MNISILTNQDFQTSIWSGGSTKQLYIFPKESTYLERNFDFRISSAKIEVESSSFTPLPGVHRHLMVLNGEITINHENHYKKKLKKFDTDTFYGDWVTNSIGTCTDFNVMTIGGIKSELTSLTIAVNHNILLNIEEQWQTVCIFVLKGNVNIEVNSILYLIKKDTLLILNNIDIFSFPLHANTQTELVISKISK